MPVTHSQQVSHESKTTTYNTSDQSSKEFSKFDPDTTLNRYSKVGDKPGVSRQFKGSLVASKAQVATGNFNQETKSTFNHRTSIAAHG